MVGLVPVTERAADGGPVLNGTGQEAEVVSRVQPGMMLVLGNQEYGDWGSVYITTKRLVWLSTQDATKGYSVGFFSLGVPVLCNDWESYPRKCIYMQIDTRDNNELESEDEDMEEDGEEGLSGGQYREEAGVAMDVSRVSQVRLVSQNPSTLDGLFQCLCTNATLNPDSVLDYFPEDAEGGDPPSCSEYVRELMGAHPRHFRNVTSMSHSSFMKLRDAIAEIPSRFRIVHSGWVMREEQLLIFLTIVRGRCTLGEACELFEREPDMIQEYFMKVAKAVRILCPKNVKMEPFCKGHPKLEDPRFAPFAGSVGAIDCTHVSASRNEDTEGLFVWRNRKGEVSQNVFAAVDFDGRIRSLLVGWEGSAHDSTLLSCAFGEEFYGLKGIYWLGDAVFALNDSILTPLRGVKYHMQDYHKTKAPSNEEELYNYRHSTLRMVVVRVFESMKKRFPILNCMPDYPSRTQCEIVCACGALHNFLLQEKGIEVRQCPVEPQEERKKIYAFGQTPRGHMKDTRDAIMARLWREYPETKGLDPF